MTAGHDPLGIAYDHTWTDSYGEQHYERNHAAGGAHGPAHWSSEHDCNPDLRVPSGGQMPRVQCMYLVRWLLLPRG